MSTWKRLQTAETKEIAAELRKKFPQTDAYRYNSAAIRVRVVDSQFKGKSETQRERRVLPLIRKFPEEIQADITLLLMLSPDELDSSLANMEFENPSLPSSIL